MAAFLRPGEKRPGAFGVTFDLDAGGSQAVHIFNKNERLALQEQRRRLPAFQHRCLHIICMLCCKPLPSGCMITCEFFATRLQLDAPCKSTMKIQAHSLAT